MSAAIADLYTSLLHKHLKQYAAWPVDSLIRLGDYGFVEGDQFKYVGNITQLGIPCKVESSPVKIVFEYKSRGVAENKIHAGASGSVPGTSISADVKMELKFATEDSLYFRSIRLTYSRIDNFAEVSAAILKQFEAGNWNGSFAFVHNLFQSGGTTIIVTNGNNATIEIEAKVKGLPQFDLADASVGLTSTDNGYVGFKVIADDKLVPLFGLAKVKPRFSWFPFLGGQTVRPMLVDRAPSGQDKSQPDAGALPGHVIVHQKPHITPEMATAVGKSVDEMFQVGEIE
jgi:hypothetical protein